MESKFQAFENRLSKVYRHLGKIARRQDISCYRVYSIDLPEFPFIIDVYKNYIYVAEYKSRHKLTEEEYSEWLERSLEIISKVFATGRDHVYLKLREKQKGEKQYQKADRQKKELIVDEAELSFIINLSDYLDTGLFLDHRITRQMVREMSEGKRVLNLFCYTGSFSVYAAAGKAERVSSVDMSKTYIHWAKRNMQYNKLYDATKHAFIQEDVLQFLKSGDPGTYDLVILDPPTFSNSKKMEGVLDIQRDHVSLINSCLSLLSQNGTLLFSTNFRDFILEENAIEAASVKDITRQTTPFDFEGKLQRKCYRIEK